MKKKLLVWVCFLFLFTSISSASEAWGININGYDWGGMNRRERLIFFDGWLTGGISGMVRMHEVSMYRCAIATRNIESAGNSDLNEMYETASKAEGFDLYPPLTRDQIIETISNIYSDPRVKTWDISEVMPLVRGRLKGGWTEKDLDEVIAYKIKQKENWKLMKPDPKRYWNEFFKKEKEGLLPNKPKVLQDLEEQVQGREVEGYNEMMQKINKEANEITSKERERWMKEK